MTTDKIDNIQIQTGAIIQTWVQTSTTGTQGTWIQENRTIGDGNSKKDKKLTNELDTIEQQ
jgi:hypothetical protein